MVRDSDLNVRLLEHRKYVDDVNRFGWLKNESRAEGRRLLVITTLHKFRATIDRCTVVCRGAEAPSDFEAAVPKHGTSSLA